MFPVFLATRTVNLLCVGFDLTFTLRNLDLFHTKMVVTSFGAHRATNSLPKNVLNNLGFSSSNVRV